MMTESVGQGCREGGGGFGENVGLEIVAAGVVVVRGGEDRVVCDEVQVGQCFGAGCKKGGVCQPSFPVAKSDANVVVSIPTLTYL